MRAAIYGTCSCGMYYDSDNHTAQALVEIAKIAVTIMLILKCGLRGHSCHAGHFKLIGGGKGLPLVAFALKDGRKDKEGNDCVYDEYDIMARMKEHHWQIPAYTLPDNAK